MFKFFKEAQYSVFDYKPRFYDAEKERRLELLNSLRESQNKAPLGLNFTSDSYFPGSIVKGGFNRNISRKSTRIKGRRLRVIIIAIVLFAIVYFFLYQDITPIIKLFLQ